MKSTYKLAKWFLLFALLFTFWSCSSTKNLNKQTFSQEEPYFIEKNVTFPEFNEPYKYIFIRFYNPSYKNPFYFANTLQGLINITEISDYRFSHCAIGFSLEDSFYGLTGTGKKELAIEHCTNTEDNEYIKNCNPEKSDQITIAIKVRQNEYYNIKKYVEECSYNPKIKYDVSINFDIGLISIKRKFFSSKEHKQFGSVEYPKNKKENNKDNIKKFVCCTFISHCLVENVPEIKQWFEKNNQNDQLVTVTDLLSLPFCEKLFSSSWADYEIAANAFVDNYPEFSPYLNN